MQTGVRKITNGRYRKIIGLFAGVKIGQIWWEGTLERDYLYLLEADPDVRKVSGQPLKIKYTLDGKEHWYTPDFLVVRTNRRQIVEVKPADKAKREKYRRMFEQVAKICEKNEYEFIVVTDEMIRVEPKLCNIKLLHKYARTGISPIEKEVVIRYFSEVVSVTLERATEELKEKGISKNQLYAMMFQGVLRFDLFSAISEEASLTC